MLTDESDRIPSTTLAVLRGILVKSLSRENLSLTDQQQLLGTRKARHVQFSLAGNRDATVQKQSRPSSANRELQKEREERIKQMKERQNEERQKKLEELKAQALAAQKFREQKEEERRRRMDDLRRRESDRRSQVEERRRAIIEADNERREYILRKNQERDQRMETKRRNDRGSIQFAFGSSTPRMIDTSDSGMCSSFWAHRRATSITNVAYTGAALTRRSSERELTDSASKKRATSASGLDRSTDDQRRMSSSMYEVFNWTSTSECPRKLTFSLAGSGINIDDPPTAAEYQPAASRNYASGKGKAILYVCSCDSNGRTAMPSISPLPSFASLFKHDTAEMNYQRTVNRRKTDLMPTIPSPRDSSRSSLGTHTPRTPGSLRSGEMTPTSLNTSRPGSAMSSSTTASGIVYRRTLPAQRKPRPASIAVTGVSASGLKEGFATSKHRLSSAGSGSITTTPAKSASGTETPTKKPLTLHSAEKRSAGARGATPKASSTPLQSPGPEKASRSLLDSLKKSADGPKKAPASKTPAQKDDAVVVEAKQEPSVAAPKVEELSAQQEAILPRDDGSQQASLVEVDQSFGQEEQPQQQQEEVVVPVQQEAPAPAQTEDAELPKQAEEVVTVEVVEQAPTTKQQQQAPLEQQDVSAVQAAEPTVMVAEEVPENVNGSLTVEVSGAGADAMTASMIAKRINTEEEAKAALAERRRLAREEAERLAELERKRIEAEEQAERQRILEEEERLRKLEEETIRLAEEQRRMEEERLQQAIEEARRRDEEERKRREEEARQKAEREEAERKAREEAERQRVEMAERLKKEEKEREERRKRVEAIMSRTRAKGAANNTPTKNNEDDKENAMSKSQIVLSSTPAALPTGTAMSASTISMTDSFIASEIRQEQQQQQQQTQHQSLEQAMESLSLSNNNTTSSNSSSSSSDTLANSSTINNNINNNNNNNTNGGNVQFDKSVTEKENLLLASSTAGAAVVVANNNLNNGSTSNGTVVEPATNEEGTNGTKGESLLLTTNGKSEQQSPAMMASSNGSSNATTANSTSDLIIEDALMGQTNGHKNGTMDNVLFPRVSDI
ncbi:AGAP001315-PC [Anopheles gambiae str. PEST]|uniref:AGAP001315-PC n=1 Tax=Anopheles gambiae TaxID=7165 RepID=Q7PKL4_ANOGA|nr:AGAP001315-PC [Anopheles gambiae str. PEST]